MQLKESSDRSLFAQLDSWNEMLVSNGSELVRHRIKFISEFNQYLKESYFKIMAGDEIPEAEYNFLDAGPENVDLKFEETLEEKKKRGIIKSG